MYSCTHVLSYSLIEREGRMRENRNLNCDSSAYILEGTPLICFCPSKTQVTPTLGVFIVLFRNRFAGNMNQKLVKRLERIAGDVYVNYLVLFIATLSFAMDIWGFVLFAGVACDRPLRPALLTFGITWLIILLTKLTTTSNKNNVLRSLVGIFILVVVIAATALIVSSATCAKTSSANGAAKFPPIVAWMLGSSLYDVVIQNIVCTVLIMFIPFVLRFVTLGKSRSDAGAFGSGSSSV